MDVVFLRAGIRKCIGSQADLEPILAQVYPALQAKKP